MGKETLYKSQIVNIDEYCNSKCLPDEIIYRIINFDDTFFFAEEISTGVIFPTFAFNKSTSNGIRFISYSYLKSGSYFIFLPAIGCENNVFKYRIISEKNSYISIPTDEEINTYINEKRNSQKWYSHLRNLEAANTYMCNLTLIKEKIKELKDGDYISNNSSRTKMYKQPLDLKPISKYGYDLSTQRDLCNLIGREKEIKEIIKATCIKQKSVILVGEPGSGKTSIVEKIALSINENPWLNGKTIFYLSTTSLIAGTKYRGIFEENMEEIIDFCKKNHDNIILFIDEIHTLVGLGQSESSPLDAINILKPYISSGDIVVIGATTSNEYSKYLAQDPAFCRRFEKIEISVPDRNLNFQILLSFIQDLEEKYQIKLDLNSEQINYIIDIILNITDTKKQNIIDGIKIENPTLAKNVIENAFVEAKYNLNEIVTIDDICLSLINCDKLSKTLRTEAATNIKTKISRIEELDKIVEFSSKTLKRIQ